MCVCVCVCACVCVSVCVCVRERETERENKKERKKEKKQWSSSILQDTRIQGGLIARSIKMYIGICLCDISFTRKQYITNTSLVMNNTDLNYEHVAQLTQAH